MRLVELGIIGALSLTCLSGCQSAYYSAWEKVGVEKRDILVDRVEDARDSQEDAQQQFSSALEEFSALIDFDGGELEDVYDALNAEYKDSKAAAEEVSSRIDNIESVADALFEEWENEIDEYQSASFKRESASKLRETRRRYDTMLNAMRRAESRMEPVLTALNDNVLFLKHNLNASAIGSLQGELSTIEGDVARLIDEMKEAIAESDAFIATLKK